MKRGQITIFVVVGIVIVTVIILGLVFRSKIAEYGSQVGLVKSMKVKASEQQLERYAQNCLEKVAKEGVIRVSASGGYYQDAPKSLDYHGFQVPIYIFDGAEYVPSFEEAAVNLARYIEMNIGGCLQAYPEQLEIGKARVKVDLGSRIKILVKQPLSFKLNQTEIKIEKYSGMVDLDYKNIYDSMLEFYDAVKNVTGGSNFVEIGALALENKHKFFVENVNPQVTVLGLTFEKVLDDNKDIDFMFALYFPKVDETSDEFFEFEQDDLIDDEKPSDEEKDYESTIDEDIAVIDKISGLVDEI